MGDTEDSGDFTAESHPEIKWKYKAMEVQLDLDMLQKFGGDEGGGSDKGGGSDLGALASGLGAPLDALTKQMADAMRVIDLTVTWPAGKYSESMRVRSIVTRDDLGMANPQQQQQQQLQQQQLQQLQQQQVQGLAPTHR